MHNACSQHLRVASETSASAPMATVGCSHLLAFQKHDVWPHVYRLIQTSDGITSSCRMILSLLRVKDFEMEDMMRSSFAEFHAQKQHPDLVKAKEEAQRKLAALKEKPWPQGPGRCTS